MKILKLPFWALNGDCDGISIPFTYEGHTCGDTPELSGHRIPNNEFPLLQLNNTNLTSHLAAQMKIKVLEDLNC